MKTFLKLMLLTSFTLVFIWACSSEADEIIPEEPPTNDKAPPSESGIIPNIIDGVDKNGNRTCDEAAVAFGVDGGFEYSTGVMNYIDGEFDKTWPGLSLIVTDGKYIEWSGTIAPGECLTNVAVIVKGTSEANVYFYPDGSLISDKGLAPPINYQDQPNLPFDLSNVMFCWNVKPEPCDE